MPCPGTTAEPFRGLLVPVCGVLYAPDATCVDTLGTPHQHRGTGISRSAGGKARAEFHGAGQRRLTLCALLQSSPQGPSPSCSQTSKGRPACSSSSATNIPDC